MPYELVLIHFNQGEAKAVPTKPLIEVLANHGITDIGSEYHETSDGLSIALTTSDLNEPTTTDMLISFRGVSPGLFSLVFDLAISVSMTVIVVDNPSIPLVLDSASVAALPEFPEADFAAPIVCESPKAIAAAVLPGFNRWEDWVASAPLRLTPHWSGCD